MQQTVWKNWSFKNLLTGRSSLLLNLIAFTLVPSSAKALDPSDFLINAFNPESSAYGRCENQILGVLDQIPGDIPMPELMMPSLWLNRDIFSHRARFSSKLFEHWMVCPSTNSDRGRIDLVVNGQLWSLLDYFERYELLQQFGNGNDRPDQRFKSGYNLRVFTKQGGKPIASYSCYPAETPNPSEARPRCRIEIRDANNGLGVRSSL